jgi:pimeloyl-ACP methyl ester carboxylesterase
MCCCCPPAITALFCLWVQSGFSKGTVAGALTFFPPDPPLYSFERLDDEENVLPEEEEAPEEEQQPDKKDKKKDKKKKKKEEAHDIELREGAYHPNEGESREKMKSPAQQLTDRAKELRKRAKKRNARDAADAKKNIKYKLVLDPRLSAPRFQGGLVEAVKIRTKTGAYVAAVIYRVPKANVTDRTKTLIYSHGNATDVGAMFPLQSIISHSLECNVVSYDYSGYGESGGVPMEANTYSDVQAVFDYTVEKVCDKDESKVVLYGQSVGSGPCCYLGCREEDLGGMILHSPFLSGMRVLTPSRYVPVPVPVPVLDPRLSHSFGCLDVWSLVIPLTSLLLPRTVQCPRLLRHFPEY